MEHIIDKIKALYDLYYHDYQMRPRYLYVGFNEMNLLLACDAFKYADNQETVIIRPLGLEIIQVSKESWLRVGI